MSENLKIAIIGAGPSGITALKNLAVAKAKGYKDSFIVLFKNGLKYSLDKYLIEIEK